MRKVGIAGAGAVGSACAMALALRRSADAIILVNRMGRHEAPESPRTSPTVQQWAIPPRSAVPTFRP
jgi:thioredoxin reductase